jgi:hypothetical protein
VAMTDIELEIRSALEDEAGRYALPPELKGRTLEAIRPRARRAPPESRVGPAGGGRRRRRRRWVYALAGVAVVPVLFGVGSLVTGTAGLQGGVSAPHRAGANGDAQPSAGFGTSTIAGPFASGPGRAPAPAPSLAPSTGPSLVAPSGSGFQQSIVRTASIAVRVSPGQFSNAWSQALAVAGHFGGLVSNSDAQTVNGRLASGSLTLQVPSTNLDGALGALAGLGTMTSESTTSQDVSGQVANDSAQLTALQAEESEYLHLLPQAKSTADILAIEQPLNTVEQQIQTLQASQAYLQSQVAMASIQATFGEPGTQPPAAKPAGRLGRAWQQAKIGVTSVIAGFIVTAGYLIAPALVALLVWAAAGRLRRRVL